MDINLIFVNNLTILSENNEVCSGHGVCECGMCKCQVTTEGRYSGRYCEKCPTCSDRCEEFKDCVQCQMYETGPHSKEECLEKCKLFTPIPVDKVVGKFGNLNNY